MERSCEKIFQSSFLKSERILISLKIKKQQQQKKTIKKFLNLKLQL